MLRSASLAYRVVYPMQGRAAVIQCIDEPLIVEQFVERALLECRLVDIGIEKSIDQRFALCGVETVLLRQDRQILDSVEILVESTDSSSAKPALRRTTLT